MSVIDMKGVDLNLLITLDVLLEVRNVTHAAERLGLSQPTTSAQLARLRQMLDDPLLMPADNGRGMVVTARALELAPALRAALKDLEAAVAKQPAFDPMKDERSFHVAASDNAIVTLGLQLVEHVSRAAGPGVRIAFHAPQAAGVAGQLESGRVDLLIGSERMVPPSMRARELVSEHFELAQRKGHPRGTAALDVESYCRLRHILVSTSGGSFRGFMDEHLERMGRRRNVVLSVPQFTLVPSILHATDYVCTLPSRLIQRYADSLDRFVLPFPAQGFGLFMAWHPRNHKDPGSVWLRDLLLSVIGP